LGAVPPASGPGVHVSVDCREMDSCTYRAGFLGREPVPDFDTGLY
jgi:hypothetical protein